MNKEEQERLLRYPHENDPRRDPDFGSRKVDYEIKQVLLAILDKLYKINDRPR